MENRMSSGISKKNFRGRQHVKHTKFALLNNSVVVLHGLAKVVG